MHATFIIHAVEGARMPQPTNSQCVVAVVHAAWQCRSGDGMVRRGWGEESLAADLPRAGVRGQQGQVLRALRRIIKRCSQSRKPLSACVLIG